MHMIYLRLFLPITLLFFSHSSLPAAVEKKIRSDQTSSIRQQESIKKKSKKVAILIVTGFAALLGILFTIYCFLLSKNDDSPPLDTIQNGELHNASICAILEKSNMVILGKNKKYYLYDKIKEKGCYIADGSLIRVSNSQRFLLILTKEKKVDFYDLQEQRLLPNIASDVTFNDCIFSSQDQYVAIKKIENNKKQLYLYTIEDLTKGKKDNPLSLYDSSIKPTFSPNDEYVYIQENKLSDNPTATLYALNGEEGELFYANADSALFSKTGRYFMTCNTVQNYVMVFDIVKRKTLEVKEIVIPEADRELSSKRNGDIELVSTNVRFTDDEQYIVFKYHVEDGTTFRIYTTDDLQKPFFYQISIEHDDIKFIEELLIQNKLILTYYHGDPWRTKKIEIHDIKEKKLIATYQPLTNQPPSNAFVVRGTHPSSLIILYLALPEEKRRMIAYDLAQNKELASKDFNKEEQFYEVSPSGSFLKMSKRQENLLMIYYSPTMQLLFNKSGVASDAFHIEENGEEVVTLITQEGQLETYNLTALSQPV